MTSAIPQNAQTPSSNAQPVIASSTASGTTSPLPGTAQAQPQARSYASAATKTASHAPSAAQAGASAQQQNAKSSTESPVNGATQMPQGGSLPNGTSNSYSDHAKKPSVVINASGATGSTPNGGPVSSNGSRPNINFGSMNNPQVSPNTQASAPYQSQNASLSTPARDPRVTSPAHSPSPIPAPSASGGRPPSMSAQSNGFPSFGSMAGDGTDQRQGQMPPSGPLTPSMQQEHMRRTSSNSMQGDPNMMRNFTPQGRGRGYPPQQYSGMPSPGPNFRAPAQNYRGQGPPASPYQHRPVPNFNPGQQQYPGYQDYQGQQGGAYGQPSYNPYAGHYQPYHPYGQYPGQAPPSPRPGQYPGQHMPYGMPQGGNHQQPPFHPTPMSRSTSTASEARPESGIGRSNTPMSQTPQPSQTPVSGQQGAPQGSNNFVRPVKSSAIRITNDKGEAINLRKPSVSPSSQTQQPSKPVIVSTPSNPTPPPRAPSTQHNRTDSNKPVDAKTAEATKSAFQEQVKKQMAEEKRKREEEEAKAKGEDTAATEAKAKAQQEKEDAESKAAKDKEDAEAAAANQVKEAAAEAEKAAAAAAADKKAEDDATAASTAAKDAEDEKARKEKEEDERLDREIAEMEAKEKEEEERQKKYDEKKAIEKEEKRKRDAAQGDEDLKRQEREAEEREAAREAEREGKTVAAEGPSDDSKAMFDSLKKPEIGPGASASASAEDSGAQTPSGEEASQEMPPPSTSTRPAGAQKPKPAHLKLETNKRVEPAEPTPGMQALKSARFLEVKEELQYPEGFKSPNPALNQGGARKGRAYDKDFLLQFQSVFKEKPSVDWDQKVRETLGPGDDSARPQSARTPSSMSTRQPSRPIGQQVQSFGGAMGAFAGGGRTLPTGTTSNQRFAASQAGQRPGGMAPPMGGRAPSQMGMGTPGVGMSRTNSLQQMGPMGGPGSPRQPSSRGGKGASRRGGDRAPSKREEAEMAAKMPLTANMDLKPLLASGSGWKPTSIGQPVAVGPDPSGSTSAMAPDMVQRKVKAALNKMTPEKFDKIADQILEIAGQSRNESDGRTLRQVIQLTFEKACDEAHWAGMYAKFCHRMLTAMSNDIRDETIMDKAGNPVVGGALFRKYLLNRCQEEFERGWQANLPEKPEGDTEEAALLSDEYYIAAAAKRKGLGLIQFIGQLYKLGMLTLRIMHECVMRLLNFEGEPDEAAIENLTTLLKSVGPTMYGQDQGRGFLDAYFARIDEVLLKKANLASRPRFMVLDLVDLRKAGWHSKDDAKGPKTITQIHAEAEAAHQKAELEKQRSNQRGPPGGRMPQGRGDARNFSGGGMPAPVDYSRTTVGMDDLRRLQNRGQRPAGGNLGPGGSLGPSGLGARAGSRRGNLGPGSSGNPSRTSTPPVESQKKEEQTNAFSALADLDQSDSIDRAKSPAPAEKSAEAEASNP